MINTVLSNIINDVLIKLSKWSCLEIRMQFTV